MILIIISFVLGIFVSLLGFKNVISRKINPLLTLLLLFSIGFKGGVSLIEQSNQKALFLYSVLVIWGFIQPMASYAILKRFTRVDSKTAAAVAACFGSVSVMTYIAGVHYLEKLSIPYEGMVVGALAIMEIPAIVSGLLIAKLVCGVASSSKQLLKESIFNKSVLVLLSGILVGSSGIMGPFAPALLLAFKPCLALFLFNMGYLVGTHRQDLRQFSWGLGLFGVYMPLLGAGFGLLLSYWMGLDVGTSTLIALLCASASYIAAPAAMRIALPDAQEAIYLPLSLGIAFPFNVVIGVPLYYQAAQFLNR